MSRLLLLSSDLNGTLVIPHTMQEMIRLAFPDCPERFERAREAFGRQTDGRLSIAEAFRIAGEASRGLTLRRAIEYALFHMDFMPGYEALIQFLRSSSICLAVVSTCYTVTLYVLRHHKHPDFPFFMRCNRLMFQDGSGRIVEEGDLETLIRLYLDPGKRRLPVFDTTTANGQINLGIATEEDKARSALEIADRLGLAHHQVAHIGDTMGDSGAILGVARAGGLGIAFNFNEALRDFLDRRAKEEMAAGRVVLVDPKAQGAALEHLLPVLEGGRAG
jgi:phosphoserine phosphatase